MNEGGYDDDNDGGLREWEENRFRRADEDARLIEEHRAWVKNFWRNTPSGFGLTRPKRYDNDDKEIVK